MVKRSKHVHKYIYQKLSKFNSGWRCALEFCDHFLPRNVENTIDGRMSLCWHCGEPFRLDEEAIKDEMPKCALHREGANAGIPFDAYEDYEQITTVLNRNGIETLMELGESKVRMLQMLGKLPPDARIPDSLMGVMKPEVDQIEVYEPGDDK